MPQILASNAPADPALPRDFGRHVPAHSDRWPYPVAAAFILALSGTAWVLLLKGGALLSQLAG